MAKFIFLTKELQSAPVGAPTASVAGQAVKGRLPPVVDAEPGPGESIATDSTPQAASASVLAPSTLPVVQVNTASASAPVANLDQASNEELNMSIPGFPGEYTIETNQEQFWLYFEFEGNLLDDADTIKNNNIRFKNTIQRPQSCEGDLYWEPSWKDSIIQALGAANPVIRRRASDGKYDRIAPDANPETVLKPPENETSVNIKLHRKQYIWVSSRNNKSVISIYVGGVQELSTIPHPNVNFRFKHLHSTNPLSKFKKGTWHTCGQAKKRNSNNNFLSHCLFPLVNKKAKRLSLQRATNEKTRLVNVLNENGKTVLKTTSTATAVQQLRQIKYARSDEKNKAPSDEMAHRLIPPT